MGQQFCCQNRVKLPDLDQDLNITNGQLIEEINQLREQHQTDIAASKIVMEGQAIFRGRVGKDGLKVGYGQYYFKHYAFFGIFDKGLPNGQGIAIKDDLSYYRGNFKDQEFDGFGKQYGSNYSYEGEFVKGNRKNGVFKNQKYEYHGTFKNNLFHGEGVIVFANGAKYEGYFSRGKIEGKGVLLLPNGKIFKGQLEQGRCKKGKFAWTPQMKPVVCHLGFQVDQQMSQEYDDCPTDYLLQMLRKACKPIQRDSTHAGTGTNANSAVTVGGTNRT